jgi:hypothetical protein
VCQTIWHTEQVREQPTSGGSWVWPVLDYLAVLIRGSFRPRLFMVPGRLPPRGLRGVGAGFRFSPENRRPGGLKSAQADHGFGQCADNKEGERVVGGLGSGLRFSRPNAARQGMKGDGSRFLGATSSNNRVTTLRRFRVLPALGSHHIRGASDGFHETYTERTGQRPVLELQAEPIGCKTRGGYFRPAPSPQSGDGALPTALPWVTAPSHRQDRNDSPGRPGRCPWRASGRLTAG